MDTMLPAATYTVSSRSMEAMLTAAALGARPRSLAIIRGVPHTLRYGAYFQYGECWLITRTSRIAPPFWGVRARVLEQFSPEPYVLLLLTDSGQGWALQRAQVHTVLAHNLWPLAADGEYKIKGAPHVGDRFESADELHGLLAAHAPAVPPPLRVLHPGART